jgi:preprotein translocase subunit SecE
MPIGHATPDVELAEAQLALGRPDLTRGAEGEEAPEEGFEDFEPEDSAAGGAETASTGEALAARPGHDAARRTNQIARVINFIQGSWRELQRVQWPDRRQVMQATGVVIGFVIIAGLYLGLADLVASKVMNFILK